MALTVGINTYVSKAEADDYCRSRYGYEVWDTAISKDAALISAKQYLDLMICGTDTATWSPVAPDDVKSAQIEIAVNIVKQGGLAASSSGEAPIKELKAGSVQLKFGDTSSSSMGDGDALRSGLVVGLLTKYGLCNSGSTVRIPMRRG